MFESTNLPRRYELHRSYWDIALVAGIFGVFGVIFARTGGLSWTAVAVWLASGTFLAALSEISYRLTNYLILHPDRVDIGMRGWGPKRSAQKWRIPYGEIESVHLDAEKTGLVVSLKRPARDGVRSPDPDDDLQAEAIPQPLGGERPRPLNRRELDSRDVAVSFGETGSSVSVRLRSLSDLHAVADYLNAAKELQTQLLSR